MEIIKRYQDREYGDMTETDTAEPEPEAAPAPRWVLPSTWRMLPGRHVRAGLTKNKGRGQSKARRRMAKASRRRNR